MEKATCGCLVVASEERTMATTSATTTTRTEADDEHEHERDKGVMLTYT
jgi:hypothetical protein